MHIHLLAKALTSHIALVVVNDKSCPLATNCTEWLCFQLSLYRCFGLCWGNREGHYPSTDRKETKRNSEWTKYYRRRQALFATIAKLQFFSHLQTATLDEERERNRELRTQIERLQNRVCLKYSRCSDTRGSVSAKWRISCYRASRLIEGPSGKNCEPVLGHCTNTSVVHVKYTQLMCVLHVASKILSN